MGKEGLIPVAKITGLHGVRGNLKVTSYAQSDSFFEPGSPMRVGLPGGEETLLHINWVKPHNRVLLMSLREITSRDMAAPLVGREVWVDRSLLPALEEGAFYWCDIIGMKVVTAADVYLGRVVSVMPTGSNDVYVVKNEQDEHLIPALASVVTEIDLNARTMRVELPAGL